MMRLRSVRTVLFEDLPLADIRFFHKISMLEYGRKRIADDELQYSIF